MERGRLRVAVRQVAVGAELRPEQEHVPGAVHRLERELALVAVRPGEEHVVAVVVVVPRRDVRLDVVEQWGLHLDVAALLVLAATEVLEGVPDHHALRVPERRAGRVLGQVEEVELAPEPAVVAAPRLLEPLQVGVEVGLRVEGGAVDAGELRLRRVAAPVGAGEAGELDRLDRLRVLEVRAAAEVGEVALRVKRDVAFRSVDELRLEGLLLGLEARLAPRRGRSPRGSRRDPPSAPSGSPPRCAGGRRPRSARGSRSRSRSRSRSAARSRPSRRDRAAGRPRPGGARRSGGAPPAHRDRTCPSWSGSGSARRPRAADAGRGRARSSARGRPARPA